MNLELEPEEYEDPNKTADIVLDALRLLISEGDEPKMRGNFVGSLGFPTSRLKSNFGPEIIWTLNVLADRALELESNSQPSSKQIRVVCNNKQNQGASRSSKVSDFIIIGQPFVGGGLTTRPLGSYQVDDQTLLLEGCEIEQSKQDSQRSDNSNSETPSSVVDSVSWYRQVELSTPMLESVELVGRDSEVYEDWRYFVRQTDKSRKIIREFLDTDGPTWNAVANRIDRHLQVIATRERFIQSSLRAEIADFLSIWQEYLKEFNRHRELETQVNLRTDRFELLNEKLDELNSQIESRQREMNDGADLREIESVIQRMEGDNRRLNVKISLLLSLYANIHSELVAK